MFTVFLLLSAFFGEIGAQGLVCRAFDLPEHAGL
jgi:hypothetical protein